MKRKESLLRARNYSKINYLVHRTAHLGECPSGRNLSKSFQNQTESARYAWKLFKIQFKINQIIIHSQANEGKGVALRARNYSKIKFKNY